VDRPFFILDRRSNLLDLKLPTKAGVRQYILSSAPTFDAPLTQELTFDANTGYKGAGIPAAHVGSRGVRVRLDPSTLTAGVHYNNRGFWLSITEVLDGGPGAPSARALIKPAGATEAGAFVVTGVAAATSEPLLLPERLRQLTVKNLHASNDLFIALSEHGAELLVEAGATRDFTDVSSGTIRLRGASVPAELLLYTARMQLHE
jgi:hypothetical protein